MEERTRAIDVGRRVFEKEVRKYDIQQPKALQDSEGFVKAMADAGAKTPEDLFAQIGYGTLSPKQFLAKVVPPERLVFTQVADFIPGVEPYDVATTVELEAAADGVRLVLTIDAMHDEHWTQMAVMGWEGELDKLARALQR